MHKRNYGTKHMHMPFRNFLITLILGPPPNLDHGIKKWMEANLENVEISLDGV